MSELEEYQAAVDAEYGVYLAAEAIDIDGARAFNVGHAVPTSHVDRGVVRADQVTKRPAKAASKPVTVEEKK